MQSRSNRNNAVIAVLIVLVTSLLAGCVTIEAPAAKSSVQDEAAVALLDTTLAAVRNLKQEIDILYNQSTEAIREVIKLEHLGVPAQEWIQYMTKQAQVNDWSPRRVNVTSDLKLFKNDKYEIVKLQFSVDQASPRRVYSNVITIYETATAKEYRYESLHSDLDAKAKGLFDQWFNKTAAELLAINTVEKVVGQSASWTASKIDGNTYYVKGGNLGLGASALTGGEWTFLRNTGKMEPANDAAMSLYRVIAGQS